MDIKSIMNVLEKIIKRSRLRSSNGIQLLCGIALNRKEALEYCIAGDYVYVVPEKRIFLVTIIHKQKMLVPLGM